MKKNYHHNIRIILCCLLVLFAAHTKAQDSLNPPVNLVLKYFLQENKVPYIKVITNKKVDRKFEPVKGIQAQVYLTEATPNNLLGKVITASNGEAKVAIPPSLKASWDSLDHFTIVASSVPSGKEEVLTAELPVKKAILFVDTANVDGVRTVTAVLKEKQGAAWVPVPAVEMKLRIKRSLGNLTVGDEETFTADSSGIASASFTKDSMPGDAKGNIALLAIIEDNDDYGNIEASKIVAWGSPAVHENGFWHRSLWSTASRAPIWLIAIAAFIITLVWGTLIYLLRQMFRIKKLGKAVAEGA